MTKPISVCKDLTLREIYGSQQQYSWTAAKKIPSDLVEYFECPMASSYQLENEDFEIVPPYACDFSLYPSEEHLALISKEDGYVMLVDAYRKDTKAIIDNWICHSNAIYDIKWLRCDRHFLTASADQSICLHDAPTKKQLIRFYGHTSSVKTLSINPQSASVFASGSRDGTIRIWDSRNNKTMKSRGCEGIVSIQKIGNCHAPEWKSFNNNGRRKKGTNQPKGNITGTVTSIAYLNDDTIVSSGSTDGHQNCGMMMFLLDYDFRKIKFWDTRKLTSCGKALPRSILSYSGSSQKSIGYSNLIVNSKYNRLFAYCLDSVIYEYDLYSTSLSPVRQYSGHTGSSFYLKQSLSPDDQFLVCGSSDSCAYIYPLEPTTCKPYILRGHQSEVTVPCWCPSDPSKLITLSDDCCVFIWQMRPDRRYRLPERKELVGMTECSSNIQMHHKAPFNAVKKSTPTMLNTSSMLGRSSLRLSQRLRQVNIQQFFTPSPHLKSPRASDTVIVNQSENILSTPFSKMENNNMIVSPKRLLLSKRDLFSRDVCPSSCQSQDSALLVQPASAASSTKRLGFDYSTTNDDSNTKSFFSPPLSDSSNSQNYAQSSVSSNHLSKRISSVSHSEALNNNEASPNYRVKSSNRKRKASCLNVDESVEVSTTASKRIKRDIENTPPVRQSSPQTPLGAAKPSSALRISQRLNHSNNSLMMKTPPEFIKKEIPEINSTPRSSPITKVTPQTSNSLRTPKSTRRRSTRCINLNNVTPITDYFKRIPS